MEEVEDEEAIITNYGAVKLQSIARMILVRSRLIKKLNERYEKIYDPRRDRYYYYDKVKDESSWGKPLLYLKSDINVISPTYVEDQPDALGSDNISKEGDTDDNDDDSEAGELDKSGSDEEEEEENESEYDSDDSEAVRERRRHRRKYPR